MCYRVDLQQIIQINMSNNDTYKLTITKKKIGYHYETQYGVYCCKNNFDGCEPAEVFLRVLKYATINKNDKIISIINMVGYDFLTKSDQQNTISSMKLFDIKISDWN